jgi:hypothetical protein
MIFFFFRSRELLFADTKKNCDSKRAVVKRGKTIKEEEEY